ncbi:cyclophilin-like fold protein [Neobacillus vireti]|uniref:cyclophilin-like fold protein n=1 Tax=Neobacillus vireti TaxID=220686 RepID=UPI002FFF12D0
MKTINISVTDKIFTASLEDNDTAKALVKQLPLTLEMSELNGNEKYNNLSGNLRADKSTSPGRINEGDLMLYGNNCLVLFYKTFNTSYRYAKLGHIDNTTGLTEALGSGSVKVTFSVSE